MDDYFYWLSTNCLTWRGLDAAGRALARFGHPAASRVQQDAAVFRKALIDPKTTSRRVDFTFRLDRARLRTVRRREGRYLLRSNLTSSDPAQLWSFYLQLVEVEETFRNLKGDLAVRPVFHQLERRIEAHIFVAFLAYCVHVTLREKLRLHAPGLTPRQLLDKFAAIQMLDVHIPTTDGREMVFTRHTQPEPDQQLLLERLGWELPPQPTPRISGKIAKQM